MPKYSKRHYEDIAAAMRVAKPSSANSVGPKHHKVRMEEWNYIVGVLAGNFRIDNPNFNASRFIDACDL